MVNLPLIKKLSILLGDKGWVNSEDSISWQRDWLNRYGKPPLGVARPCSTKEISKVLSLCHEYSVHVIPQGGNTGLVGGSVVESKNAIILSLDRMNTIYELDDASGSVSLEAGVILQNLHQFLEGTGLMFPLHLGSQGSTQIGGLISTNAGGSHAFRYGMMQDLVLGLQVVLPNGDVWDGMRAVQKDNTGYQLRKLFCGSEGTLGIITKAILKLSPQPSQSYTALVAVKDFSGLIEFRKKLRQEVGEFLTALEFFSDVGLEMAIKNIPGILFPLQIRTPFYLLIEVESSSMNIDLNLLLEEAMQWGMRKKIVIDGSIAQSKAQQAVFWNLREEQPEGQRRLGMQLKHDISVPPGLLEKFLKIADEQCNSFVDGIRINAFGHLGDGNIHYNLSPPLGQRDFQNFDNEISKMLYKLAISMKGSFAAEHGIGRAKLSIAEEIHSSVERNLMKSIKASIDKSNQLNPDVLVSLE
tara:strand:+ start:3715 stop:5124 length:1410 start_codon:yes stop_codon:yes gene_type:complete